MKAEFSGGKMFSKYLLFLVLVTISSVISNNVSFKNVTLWIWGKNLTTIPSANNLKDYLPRKWTSMILVTGTIPILYENSVTDIENVNDLQFIGNEIIEIRPGAFKNLKSVETIRITGSNITTIAGVFDNLTLEQLSIGSNKISVIPSGVVKSSDLKELSFANNIIETVEENAFDHLPNLKTLDLSHNLLSDLPSGIFRNLSHITYISLDNNKFTTIKGEIFDNSSILNLYLADNLLKTLSENFMKQMPNLIGIYLNRNHLTEIPAGIFNNQTVQHVDLSNNEISYIAPNAFDNMPNLTDLFLPRNKLQQYDSRWLHNCPKIYRLFLSNNLLEQLPDQAFKNLNNKKEQWVKLDSNKIKKISAETFKGWKRVDTLELNSNEIKVWHEDYLADVEIIRTLNLVNNKIVCLDGDFDKVFKAKRCTYLGNNPFSNDCKRKIREWSARNPHKVVV
ncbi:leucine-rich repeat-containing protein 15-like [Tribolium madens]|uniref:leucine-rich repeat-containing protein 15-like n=1 Tax=Tribolium madens TaxID=41895 RepID=UPI001CF741C5|nr:leucine-rich repeat-containing protein 15-like [Tribolium madens]